MINDSNLLQLKDANGNAIGTGVKIGDRLSIDSNGVLSADVQQGTVSDEIILTSPSGYKFKVIVNDEGVLSTEEIITRGL